jgi:hypothetical protein
MGKAKGGGEDRKNFFKLVQALEDAGISGAHQIAELIATLVNQKIEHSEGRHHARFHKTRAESENAS